MNPDQKASKLVSQRDAYFTGEGGIVGALERSSLGALIFPMASQVSDNLAAGGELLVITLPLGYLPDDIEVE